MDTGYRLIEYLDEKQRPFWELASSSGRSELEKLISSPKTRTTARKLLSHVSKINDYGIQISSATSKVRLLDSKASLYEIKGFNGTDREMAYVICRDSTKVVLLYLFKGHQGSGNIHAEIKYAKKLAKIASKLLDAQLDQEQS